MEDNIYNKILCAQKNRKAMEELLTQFDPLITKYAKKLDYEDAYSDIITLFIEKIQKLKCQELRTTDDYTLLKYIKKIIQSISCNLFNKNVRKSEIHNIELSGNSPVYINEESELEKYFWSEDEYPLIFWDFLNSLLTKHQAQIVMYIVAKGYSVNQVAKIYGVSPEAITLSKNRAYKKLRNYFTSNN